MSGRTQTSFSNNLQHEMEIHVIPCTLEIILGQRFAMPSTCGRAVNGFEFAAPRKRG